MTFIAKIVLRNAVRRRKYLMMLFMLSSMVYLLSLSVKILLTSFPLKFWIRQVHHFELISKRSFVVLRPSLYGAESPSQGCRFSNYKVAPRSIQPFIPLRSTSWVPESLGNLVGESKSSPISGCTALSHLNVTLKP